jgi:hypothetical protein
MRALTKKDLTLVRGGSGSVDPGLQGLYDELQDIIDSNFQIQLDLARDEAIRDEIIANDEDDEAPSLVIAELVVWWDEQRLNAGDQNYNRVADEIVNSGGHF